MSPEDVSTFKGRVVGKEESRVRITMTNDWISGYVKTEEGRFFIEPLTDYDREADQAKHVLYHLRDTEFNYDLGHDYIRAPDTVSSSMMTDFHMVTHKYPTTLTADVILDCDEEFYDQGTSNWQSRQLAVANNAEANFNSQVDIQFDVVQQSCDTTNSELSSTNASDLLDDLGDRWSSSQTSRHLVHLLTGKQLTGATIGIAWQPGIHDPENFGYGLSQMVSDGGYSASSFQKEILVSHEIGHNFDGDHGDAADYCDPGTCTTIMWPTTGSSSTDIFSDGTGNPALNNEERVRDEAEDNL